jgi:hypothetical protein
MTRRRHLVRDYALYLLISLAVATTVMVGAIRQWPKDIFFNVFGFCGSTAVVFGMLIEQERALRRTKRFWVWLLLLSIPHSLFFFELLHHGVTLGNGWWIFVIEAALFYQLTVLVFKRRSRQRVDEPRMPEL